jgi:hypothetical protein
MLGQSVSVLMQHGHAFRVQICYQQLRLVVFAAVLYPYIAL